MDGNWYRVEPIRWILITDASSTQSGYISTDTMAVMESVVYVGKYSDTALSLGNGYVSANSVSGSDVNYFYNNFLLNERLYLTEFTAESSAFSSSSITISETSTSYIFLSSNEEINEAKGNYETEFSDFVKDYLDMIGQNDLYYVRDLGSNLNTVSSHTEGGGTVNSKPTDFLGMRFTIQVSEYVCLS